MRSLRIVSQKCAYVCSSVTEACHRPSHSRQSLNRAPFAFAETLERAPHSAAVGNTPGQYRAPHRVIAVPGRARRVTRTLWRRRR
eukprot:303852-Rhodomonas_salina.3